MNSALLIVAVAVAVLSLVLLAWALLERARANRAEAHAWRMREDFAETEARLRLLEQSGDLVRAQAAQSAGAVADELLKRADENFRNRELLAQQRIEAQLKPVAESLAKFETQVQQIEKARAEETGGLKAQIAALMQASEATQGEARKLSAALRRGAGVQGRWGEQALRNVLEAAGLNNRFDFEEQFSTESEEGRRRPDVKVRMPGGGMFVIDAKCSLNAFLEAQEATDDALREAALVRHAQSIKTHMVGLSNKAYWDQFRSEATPDFVAMFVPGDGYLAAALERQPDLLSEAMDKRVVIVTPSTLFALCKAVAYGWRAEDQAANAQEVAQLGRELYKRLSTMGGHVASVGKALTVAVERFNQFVGSLESQVLTQARRFEDLAVDHEGREIPEITMIEPQPKGLTKPELVESAAEKPALSIMKGGGAA
ncbi:MAG: DNA recombination protein RmuC [Caulobacteraceae bacterium]|nr:DNA recombination protein RmuC [Caulobacteraceae bacterium]